MIKCHFLNLLDVPNLFKNGEMVTSNKPFWIDFIIIKNNGDLAATLRSLKDQSIQLSLKKKKGGYENVRSKGQSDTSTSEFLVDQFNVSESTVKRNAKFADGVNIIDRTNPMLKMKILTGEAKVIKSGYSKYYQGQKNNNQNISRLFNKAKIIRGEISTSAIYRPII